LTRINTRDPRILYSTGMGKALVVYYSWTGHTRQIAEAIAAELSADVEEIREVRPRAGWVAYFRSVWEALRSRSAPIGKPQKNASAYDLVVLGTPVWAGRVASPMRTYIAQERGRFARIALFCTEGGANGEKAMAQVAQLCGKEPAATLIVTERDIRSGAYRQKVADFAKALR
jgi:flavodoxin